MRLRWLWTALACVACSALGFGAGAAWILQTIVEPLVTQLADSSADYLGCMAEEQYRCAPYPAGKAALVSHLALIQPLVERTSGSRRDKYARQVALTYSRLAVASGRAGDTSQRAAYLAKAHNAWTVVGESLSESQIDELVGLSDGACGK